MNLLSILVAVLGCLGAPAGVERSVQMPFALESLQSVKAMTHLNVYIPATEPKLTLPPFADLESLQLSGSFRLQELLGLAEQKKLTRLYIVGHDRESRVDLKGLGVLPKVSQLTLRRVRIDSAKEIEKMTSLEKVFLDRVTFDVPVDWKKLPNLKQRSGS